MRAGDDPQAYLALDRRRALTGGDPVPDRVQGAALFLDISGFTPLTEALAAELGPREGADALSAVLGRVFEPLIEVLHRWRADVIYFSGDAVTCWLDGDDGASAVTCGLELQATMAQVGRQQTPSGRVVTLGAKVALAVGPARRFVVGDPQVQLIEVLAGRLMDRLADAEQRAEVGQVVLDTSVEESLGHRLVATDGVARGLVTPLSPPPARPLPPALPEDVVRQWLLPPVYERLQAGQGEFLADLRPAVPLFLSFGGIDYDTDPEAPRLLDEFVVRAQQVIDRFGGSTLQLTLGDKGAYLYAVFGSPLAHEDDDARACAAALELLGLGDGTAATDLRIGIARGRLRSGTYGHPDRRTFCCLGDAVNLAARLMSKAGPGQVYVSGRVHQAAEERFSWQPLPAMPVKGKRDPVPVFALLGPATGAGTGGTAGRIARRFGGALIGREAELAVLEQQTAAALAGAGRVLHLIGEAGTGKSRLAAELITRLQGRGVAVHAGESSTLGAAASYPAWREVWTDLLDLRPASGEPPEARLAELLGRIDPALTDRAPLLGPLLDLPLTDTDLTRSFDAKLRKASLEDLLATVLEHLARRRPRVLLIDDAHAMDPLSHDLLEVFRGRLASLPVLVLLCGRPTPAEEGGRPEATTVQLGPLSDAQIADLVRSTAPGLADPLVERAVTQAQGNPFFAEELAGFVGQFADRLDVELPESLSSLVLSRIDTLPEGPRRAAKVASVLGRSFTPGQLSGVHPQLGAEPAVAEQVGRLDAEHLTVPDDVASGGTGLGLHSFRQVLVRDVAYESLPSDMRAELHERAGDHLSALAEQGRTSGDQLLDLLAYHYARGRDEPKKRSALLAAARAAQARYANRTALGHYRAVLPLLVGPQEQALRGEVLLALGQVLELIGDWDGAAEPYREAFTLAGSRQDRPAAGWARVALAEIARKQGRFPDASAELAAAAADFEAVDERHGTGRVLHLRGTLAAQQGDYPSARADYEASLRVRVALGDRAGEAALLSNLGVVAEYTGDYPEAQRLNEAALEVRTEIGDRWAIAVSQNNLGMVALLQKDHRAATARFTEALRLQREVGDAWMVAIAQNNLANALRALGDLDGALAGYAEALTGYLSWDDSWAIAILLEDLAVALLGDTGAGDDTGVRADALQLLGAAETLRVQLGSPRSPSLDQELAEAVALRAHPDDAAQSEIGRTMDVTAATGLAMRVCRQSGPLGTTADGMI